MTAPLIISVSGLRGTIGETLTPWVAQHYALAAAAVMGPGPILLARDSRSSGAILADAITAVLTATGRSILDAGVAATPTVGILVRRHQCAGGIQISASHNPIEFNGLKIFAKEGRVVPKLLGEQILAKYEQLSGLNASRWHKLWVPVDQLGKRTRLADTLTDHLTTVLNTVDISSIRSRKFRVLLDSNGGAGSLLGIPLLQALHCDVLTLGGEPNGTFEHTPEPLEQNVQTVGEKVRELGCDLGFCQDPDADRLAIIDDQGHYCGEEYTTALCAWNRLEKFQQEHCQEQSGQQEQSEGRGACQGTLVINCATSRMTMDLAERFGFKCLAAPVGEANVVDCMLAQNALYGGEGNGGPIDPAVGYVRDSFVGMAQILELAARHRTSIASLVAGLQGYAIVKRKIPTELAASSLLLDKLAERLAYEKLNRQDGLRIDWPDRWVLVRASNTEPIMRIIAEARDQDTALALCREMEEHLIQIGETGQDENHDR
ncbi:MAG: phosphoglucosamine mutase [Planctomycetia bacterium]|nr:phosphoglucosamine mutase [Planctomycetia bacterium]